MGFGIDLLPAGALAPAAPSPLWPPRFCQPSGCCLGTRPWLLEVGRLGSARCLVSQEWDGHDRGGGGQLSRALRASQALMIAFWWVWWAALLEAYQSVMDGAAAAVDLSTGRWVLAPGP